MVESAHGDHGAAHAGDHADAGHGDGSGHDAGPGAAHAAVPVAYSGDWYTLYEGGRLKLSIGWYIDSLTILMFVVVTFIATCIHVYASGYMHDELHDVTDHEVHLADGGHLHRPGRFPRFFQALSLFCFSMLGIVIAGNLAMVFIFWELVGICSWFLIGFYYERKSASTAANKAFIVNRVGDFGMLIGLMALWGALGTLHFADSTTTAPDGRAVTKPGLFSLVRPAEAGPRAPRARRHGEVRRRRPRWPHTRGRRGRRARSTIWRADGLRPLAPVRRRRRHLLRLRGQERPVSALRLACRTPWRGPRPSRRSCTRRRWWRRACTSWAGSIRCCPPTCCS